MGSVILRPLASTDVEVLVEATLGTMNWCGERLTRNEIVSRSEFSHYTRLAPSRGDYGFVAEDGSFVAGVVWALFLPREDAGYGYLDDLTPEVSLWVQAGHRGRGLGRALLRRAITEAADRGIARVSLSVESGNHAQRLYASEGFAPVPGREDDGVMLWTSPLPAFGSQF